MYIITLTCLDCWLWNPLLHFTLRLVSSCFVMLHHISLSCLLCSSHSCVLRLYSLSSLLYSTLLFSRLISLCAVLSRSVLTCNTTTRCLLYLALLLFCFRLSFRWHSLLAQISHYLFYSGLTWLDLVWFDLILFDLISLELTCCVMWRHVLIIITNVK